MPPVLEARSLFLLLLLLQCWGFVATCWLSLLAVSGSYSPFVTGFSLPRLLLLGTVGSRSQAQ